MCDPNAINLGISLANTTAQSIQDISTNKMNAKYATNTARAASDNFILQTRQMNNRYAEEQAASSMEQQEVYIQNLQRQAISEASAASNGVSGISIDNLFKGYDRATAVGNYTSARNLKMKGLQMNDELLSLKNKALSSINATYNDYNAKTASTAWGTLGSSLELFGKLDYSNLGPSLYKAKTNFKHGNKIDTAFTTGGLA